MTAHTVCQGLSQVYRPVSDHLRRDMSGMLIVDYKGNHLANYYLVNDDPQFSAENLWRTVRPALPRPRAQEDIPLFISKLRQKAKEVFALRELMKPVDGSLLTQMDLDYVRYFLNKLGSLIPYALRRELLIKSCTTVREYLDILRQTKNVNRIYHFTPMYDRNSNRTSNWSSKSSKAKTYKTTSSASLRQPEPVVVDCDEDTTKLCELYQAYLRLEPLHSTEFLDSTEFLHTRKRRFDEFSEDRTQSKRLCL